MTEESTYDARSTAASVQPVPKQSTPPKVPHSIRISPWLDNQVTEICNERGLTFNAAVERALEAWVEKSKE